MLSFCQVHMANFGVFKILIVIEILFQTIILGFKIQFLRYISCQQSCMCVLIEGQHAINDFHSPFTVASFEIP